MSAKTVKIVSSLCMVVGIVAVMASGEEVNLLTLLLPVGFVGFIVGRFME